MSSTAPRDHLVDALRAHLVGPYSLGDDGVEPERLELRPSAYYLTGFLVPDEDRPPEGDDADDELGAGPDEPKQETQGEERGDSRPNVWPASKKAPPAGSGAARARRCPPGQGPQGMTC